MHSEVQLEVRIKALAYPPYFVNCGILYEKWRKKHMPTLYIEPTDEIQAIQDAIHATKPGTNVIFKQGVYMLDRTLRFVGGRSYISEYAAFRCAPEWEGSMIEVTARPDAEKSWLERKLYPGPTVLLKIVGFVCRLLRIPFDSGTLVAGFHIYGNRQNTGIHSFTNDEH